MSERSWEEIRNDFHLTQFRGDFSFMALGPLPMSIGRTIEEHRRLLDEGTITYANRFNPHRSDEVFNTIGAYFGIDSHLVTHTHSTTMGLAEIYGGIPIKPGQEILTSQNEHFTTLDTLRLRQRRDGTPFRQVPLFADSSNLLEQDIIDTLQKAITENTRVLALTWVYSSDGVKLPVKRIAEEVVAQANATRDDPANTLLFALDGVHGFGVEDVTFSDLGCDLFTAGCHKWILGPRGTAIICGKEDALKQVVPIVPTFSARGGAHNLQPGGTKAVEHIWALADAFRFVMGIGKTRIQDRVHDLARRLKDGLSRIERVHVRTPMSSELSAGIVCFDIDGMTAAQVVDALKVHGITATVSSMDATANRTHARLSPFIVNMPEEIDAAAKAVARVAAAAPSPPPHP